MTCLARVLGRRTGVDLHFLTPAWRLLTALCIGAIIAGRASAAESTPRWVEIRAPHFTVYADGNVKQARKVAAQFEAIRGLFQQMWPWARLDPGRPIVILAARDERSLRSLMPEFWERKGGTRPSGIFVGGEDRLYVALRTDLAEGDRAWEENPYDIVYHEYTHLILDLNFGRLPAWLNEGLAEFFGATIIGEDEMRQGKPLRSHIYLLRERAHLPLDRLLEVDHDSPEYNEESRASVFYAQCWALVHYFLIADEGAHRQPFTKYINLLRADGDEKQAREALGDLTQLGRTLEKYVRNVGFHYRKGKIAAIAAPGQLDSREVTEPEVLAIRGDFHLARGQRQLARPLLEQAVERAPDLTAAQASLGLLEFREENRAEARRRVARAVELDSTSFLVNYLHALLNMESSKSAESLATVEQSLGRSVALNQQFAPAYALLAEVTAYRNGDHARALGLARRAVALEPGVARHRLAVGRLLTAMGRYDEAGVEGNRALAGARSDADRASAQRFLATLVRPTPPSPHVSPISPPGEPARESPAEPVRIADGARQKAAPSVTVKGVIISMACHESGELLFIVQTATSGRLGLLARSPDQLMLRRNGAYVQMDWTCGALGIPVRVTYIPRKEGATGPDGIVASFELDP
jgi:tetratricopeptide (TPR) repeat protein